MLAELARLHRELPDVTILYVTHDQVEALTLADRIAVMDRARLQDVGTPRELYRAPRTEFTASFVGNANLLPVTVGSTGVAFDGVELQVDTQGAAKGAAATLCVRPHLVGLGPGPTGWPGSWARSSGAGPPTVCTWTWAATGSWPTCASCGARRLPARRWRCTSPQDAVLLAAGVSSD